MSADRIADLRRRPRVPRPGKALTNREQVVLTLVAQGLSNDEIAERTAVVRGTVQAALRRVFAKLEAINRANAVHEGWRRGYLGSTGRAQRLVSDVSDRLRS